MNNDYDTYDSAVVSANSVKEAQNIHPNHEWYTFKDGKEYKIGDTTKNGYFNNSRTSWVKESYNVKVTLLGKYAGNDSRVILASFNAG